MQTLVVPGTLESLGAISRFVMAAAAAVPLSDKSAYRLRLAVDEIATNIVTHGYQASGRNGNLDLRSETDGGGLTIILEDTGTAYDPGRAQHGACVDRPLEERPLGGLGLYLAIHNVDRFHYERVGDRNRHTLFMRRKESPAED